MRDPKIIDELYGGKITVVQLVLTIPNPIEFAKNMIKLVHNYIPGGKIAVYEYL